MSPDSTYTLNMFAGTKRPDFNKRVIIRFDADLRTTRLIVELCKGMLPEAVYMDFCY